MRIGIIAALPAELKPLVRSWTSTTLKDKTQVWTHNVDGDVWIAACSGMGADAARRAFAGAEVQGALDMVLTIGWAGAVDPSFVPGQVGVMSIIIDAKTGEQFQLTEGERKLRLVTAPRVASAEEKNRLRATYRGVAMVDMEAAAIARLAKMRQIPMACIKGVSDGASANLPDMNPFINNKGKLRMGAFLLYLALRPRYWNAIAELRKNADKAAQVMCDLILEFMKEKDVARLNRTGNP